MLHQFLKFRKAVLPIAAVELEDVKHRRTCISQSVPALGRVNPVHSGAGHQTQHSRGVSFATGNAHPSPLSPDIRKAIKEVQLQSESQNETQSQNGIPGSQQG